MVKITAQGAFKIKYKEIYHSFENGVEYDLDSEFATMLIKDNRAIENGKNKSKKTDDSVK